MMKLTLFCIYSPVRQKWLTLVLCQLGIPSSLSLEKVGYKEEKWEHRTKSALFTIQMTPTSSTWRTTIQKSTQTMAKISISQITGQQVIIARSKLHDLEKEAHVAELVCPYRIFHLAVVFASKFHKGVCHKGCCLVAIRARVYESRRS